MALPTNKYLENRINPTRARGNPPTPGLVLKQIGKFWLIAKYDVATLPRFLEFSVAFHLALIEDLAVNIEARMKEWNAEVTRGWLVITRTPHFEGQLLKDIDDIRGDEEMYQKLSGQIIQSVQRRYPSIYQQYNWNDEQVVLDSRRWSRRRRNW